MFEITIKETKAVKGEGGGNWQKIGESNNPYDNDSDDIRNPGTRDVVEGSKDVYAVYGYTPTREVNTTKETELFKQSVEKLDLARVIKAINNL